MNNAAWTSFASGQTGLRFFPDSISNTQPSYGQSAATCLPPLRFSTSP